MNWTQKEIFREMNLAEIGYTERLLDILDLLHEPYISFDKGTIGEDEAGKRHCFLCDEKHTCRMQPPWSAKGKYYLPNYLLCTRCFLNIFTQEQKNIDIYTILDNEYGELMYDINGTKLFKAMCYDRRDYKYGVKRNSTTVRYDPSKFLGG